MAVRYHHLSTMTDESFVIPESWIKIAGPQLEREVEATFFEINTANNPKLVKAYISQLEITDEWLARYRNIYAQNQTMITALIHRLAHKEPVLASYRSLHDFFKFVDPTMLQGWLKTNLCMFYAQALIDGSVMPFDVPPILSKPCTTQALLPGALALEAGRPWVISKVKVQNEKVEPVSFLYKQLKQLTVGDGTSENLRKSTKRYSC